jgi:hypothetical protein
MLFMGNVSIAVLSAASRGLAVSVGYGTTPLRFVGGSGSEKTRHIICNSASSSSALYTERSSLDLYIQTNQELTYDLTSAVEVLLSRSAKREVTEVRLLGNIPPTGCR